jgi:hypothetical protein
VAHVDDAGGGGDRWRRSGDADVGGSEREHR